MLRVLLIIILLFFQSENIWTQFSRSTLENNIVDIDSYYILKIDGKEKIMKNRSKGFTIDDRSLLVTTFNNIKGAKYIYANFRTNKNESTRLKLYPGISTSHLYYWIDEQRDIIIFKIEELTIDSDLSLEEIPPIPGDTLYTIDNNEKLQLITINQIFDLYTSVILVSDFPCQFDLTPGLPFTNKSQKIIGMLLFIERNGNKIFLISAESIVNAKTQLINKYGSQLLKKQIYDYSVSPEIINSLIPSEILEYEN